jgi:hypothetical protein
LALCPYLSNEQRVVCKVSTGDTPRPEPAIMKWWWPGVNAVWWSPEERLVRTALAGTTTVLFVLLSLPQWWLFSKLDLDPQIEVVGIFVTVAVAGPAARPIGERLSPELLRKGDAKAAQRLAARERRP